MLVEATRNTFVLAGINALLSPVTAVIVAYIIVRTKLPCRRTLDFFIWAPSAIPGILSGLGLMWMFLGMPFLRPVYGTIYALVIVTVLNQLTSGSVIMKAALVQLGTELEDASRMSGAGYVKTIFKVIMPLVSQTTVLLAVLSFMFSAQATSSIILLASTETRTLALVALEAILGGAREVASVVVFLITLLTAGVAIVARWYGLRIGLQQIGR
jgi:iron(III) transport system permease protein